MIQTLRYIRNVVKAHYQTTTIVKPKFGSLFLTTVNKSIDHLDGEAETDIQELIQLSSRDLLNEEAEVLNEVADQHNAIDAEQLHTEDDPKRIESHLLEFAEKAINKRDEIGEEAYLAYLFETTEKIRYSLSPAQEKISRTANQAISTPPLSQTEKQKTFIASVEPFSLQIRNLISINSPFKNEIADFASVIEDAESILSDLENIVQATERGDVIDISEDYGFFQLTTDYIEDDFRIAWERHIAKGEAIRESTSTAAKKRHSVLREWKKDAQELCRTEWRTGSSRLHNKIVIYIMTQDRFKTSPQKNADGKDIRVIKSPEKVLLRALAEVADEPEFKHRNLKFGVINKK